MNRNNNSKDNGYSVRCIRDRKGWGDFFKWKYEKNHQKLKIRNIYDLEAQNRQSIYLVRDGNFFRAYERSALFFTENVEHYHLLKRVYKTINAEMVYLGFPQTVLPRLLRDRHLKVHSETSEFLVLNSFSSTTDFNEPRLLDALWCAYFEARCHKRNTCNAIQFELNLERNIHQLYEDILFGTYHISPSICFIVQRPVMREIFAAHFRDRVVHHYVVKQLMPIFENQFIYDTYSCRKRKGTWFGIHRLQHFIRSCSDNYQRETFILKLDIQGFFMSINKKTLWEKVSNMVRMKYEGWDKIILLNLLELIIMNNPTENVVVKGNRKDWKGLPTSKSLFTARTDCGLPIGNLTSQIFANYYLNDFDHYMKEKLKLKYYGRYVDDFFVVHHNPRFLKSLIPQIREYLQNTLSLSLHSKKIYLQSCYKGVNFLGVFLLPFRMVPTHRVKRNFVKAMEEVAVEYGHKSYNFVPNEPVDSRINSYLGFFQHVKAFRFCKKIMNEMPLEFQRNYEVEPDFKKVRCWDTFF